MSWALINIALKINRATHKYLMRRSPSYRLKNQITIDEALKEEK